MLLACQRGALPTPDAAPFSVTECVDADCRVEVVVSAWGRSSSIASNSSTGPTSSSHRVAEAWGAVERAAATWRLMELEGGSSTTLIERGAPVARAVRRTAPAPVTPPRALARPMCPRPRRLAEW